MDVLADEIARARKEAQERRAAAAAGRPSKYQRRGDLERSAASEVAQVKADGSKEAVPATPPRASGDGKEAESGAAAESTPILPQAELVRRLRAFSVPVLLFGETPAEQNARLRSHRLQAHDRAHGSAAGKYDNLQRKIEKEIESEMAAAQVDGGHQAESPQRNRRAELEKYKDPKFRADFEHVEDYILYFFKRLLLLWEKSLNDRPEEERRSVQGRKAAATHKQTRLYIRPLLKLLKRRDTPADILRDITKIVDLALQREYVQANDWYLRMSIGNAPWPMGVTMVGIHERKGREKIFSQSIAHVLNDETQRKYIQSIKRLLSFAQTINPNPSNTKNVG